MNLDNSAAIQPCFCYPVTCRGNAGPLLKPIPVINIVRVDILDSMPGLSVLFYGGQKNYMSTLFIKNTYMNILQSIY
jgi:hypothetical protein